MAQRLCIRTDTDACIHFDTGINGYSLCGLETQGDSVIGIQSGRPTTRKVNCPDCIRIVRFCKEIKGYEYVKENK